MDFDVLIVGAGPSGLIAARDIAKEGWDVCVVEKSQEIGYPVKCSGLFSVAGLEQLGVEVDDSIVCSTIRGGRFYSPGGDSFLAYSKQDRAHVIERKLFDKVLAKEAIRAGARISLKTTATALKVDDGVALKVAESGEEKTVRASLVIGADGAGSNVAKWTGFKRDTNFVSAVQFEVAAADIEEDVAEVYVGRRYAPGFYAWILPKGEVYEVGVGSDGSGSEPPMQFLRRFIKEHPIASDKIDSKSVLEFNRGAIPVGGPKESTVSDRVMLVGDAAGQTKASTGGGVVTGGICARMAARASVKALEEKDYSREFLVKEYESRWRDELEKEFAAHLFLKSLMGSASDAELDNLFKIVKEEGVPELMTRHSDTDRPFAFVKDMLKKDTILTWAQDFLDIRKEYID